MSFLLRGSESGGPLSITEGLGTKGNEPPTHVQHWEHETYHIIDGAAEFYVEVRPGGFVAGASQAMFLPQGKAHALRFRSDVFRTLLMAQATGERPVGMDSYSHDISTPAPNMELPRGLVTYASGDVEEAIALRKGIQVLTPDEARARLPDYPNIGAASAGAARP